MPLSVQLVKKSRTAFTPILFEPNRRLIITSEGVDNAGGSSLFTSRVIGTGGRYTSPRRRGPDSDRRVDDGDDCLGTSRAAFGTVEYGETIPRRQCRRLRSVTAIVLR